MDLNEFHQKNWQRMHEAFPPAHGLTALVVCVGEEVGELCAAVLGVTGEKKRKAHLTNADVLDACADAATYLSLVMRFAGCENLEAILGRYSLSGPPLGDIMRLTLWLQRDVGYLANEAITGDDHDELRRRGALAFQRCEHVARAAGCENWRKLLRETFNMVSERAGSPIRVKL